MRNEKKKEEGRRRKERKEKERKERKEKERKGEDHRELERERESRIALRGGFPSKTYNLFHISLPVALANEVCVVRTVRVAVIYRSADLPTSPVPKKKEEGE